MNQGPVFFSVLFPFLMAMVLIWFLMVATLFKRLRAKHPETYKEMGEPSLFWNNSMKTNWAMLEFLRKRRHKGLNDKSLSLLSDFMLVFLAVYMALFLGMFFGILCWSWSL